MLYQIKYFWRFNILSPGKIKRQQSVFLNKPLVRLVKKIPLNTTTADSLIKSLDANHIAVKRRSRHRPARRYKLKYFFKWLKKDPTKFIAYICFVVLVYITVLFVQYANDQKKDRQNMNANKESNINADK